MGYLNLGDRMADSYLISQKTWKWTKENFFPLGPNCTEELYHSVLLW
jgi:hypothetical protein